MLKLIKNIMQNIKFMAAAKSMGIKNKSNPNAKVSNIETKYMA